MAFPSTSSIYDRIYRLDLVYEPDCWRKCGDAHCCSFSRHKAKFRFLAKEAGQELPLLPGEFEFLASSGWTRQFREFERRRFEYDFGSGTVVYETVFSSRFPCACDHDTRTTVCRLYPLLPTYETDGRVTGAEPLGIYEELEAIGGLRPACELSALPFSQIGLFLEIANLLGRHPKLLFHLMAYRLAKRHVAGRIRAAEGEGDAGVFALFERRFMRRRLFDHATLKRDLEALWRRFAALYGDRFLDEIALPR